MVRSSDMDHLVRKFRLCTIILGVGGWGKKRQERKFLQPFQKTNKQNCGRCNNNHDRYHLVSTLSVLGTLYLFIYLFGCTGS